jgi:hypothetical protein
MGRSGWFARILSGVQHAPHAFDAGFQRLEVGFVGHFRAFLIQ